MAAEHRRSFRSLRPPSESGTSETSGNSYGSSNATFGNRSTLDRVVKLNVGGRKFDTTEATLGCRGDNFLTSLVTSQIPSIRDDSGRYFIDRSGNLFEIILEFLRSSTLQIPPNVSIEAVEAEADYYGISLPSQDSSSGKKIKYGLFVSTKYGENEIIVFSDICTGYIIRGGSSKVQFRYRTDGDGVLEVVWSTDIRNRQAQKERAALTGSRSSISSSNRRSSELRGTHTPGSGSPSHSTPLADTASPTASQDEPPSLPFSSSNGYTKSTIWFLQENQLITNASNVYTFVPNLREFPSSIFTNLKAGIAIYDGMVSGFRLPKSNSPPPFLLNAQHHFSMRRGGGFPFAGDEALESPPPNSPISHEPDNDGTGSDDASLDAREAVFVDIRNQWVKCEFNVTSYCDSVVAYQVTCRPIESIRYKSSLPYPFGGTNEYEWCREAFNLELIVLEDHLIARLVSYNLIRKDRSTVTMQYNTAFHRFARQGSGTTQPALVPE